MKMDVNDFLDLELEFQKGGWSLETQRDLIEWIRGEPLRFISVASRDIYAKAIRSGY